MIVLGLPLVGIFDPDGTGAVFAGLVLGAFTLMVPTGIYLALPRRWGMPLFAAESLLLWLLVVHQASPTRILSGFVLWSLIELPMYAFELLGLLEDPRSSTPPSVPPKAPPLLLAWLMAIGIAGGICYVYASATPMTTFPPWVRTVAYLYLPLAPLLAVRNVIRRLLPIARRSVPSTPVQD